MQPRDVVFVDPVPVVRWGRVASQIVPSATAVASGVIAADPRR